MLSLFRNDGGYINEKVKIHRARNIPLFTLRIKGKIDDDPVTFHGTKKGVFYFAYLGKWFTTPDTGDFKDIQLTTTVLQF